MCAVRDRGGRTHGGSDKDHFRQFGFRHTRIHRVRAMNFEAVRALRGERDGNRNQLFVAARDRTRRHGRAVEDFERLHGLRRQRFELRQFR